MKKNKIPEAEKKAEKEAIIEAEKEAIEAEEEEAEEEKKEELEAEEEEKEELEADEEKKGKTKRICISLGESLLGKIDEEAEAEERSRSGYIARKLRVLHK